MFKEERQRKILELLQAHGDLTVTALARRFDVTDMTIRRDLRDLNAQGLIRRIHGGAMSGTSRISEPPYNLRSTKNIEAKRAIGRKAATLVREGDSVALDIGTTTPEIVPHLAGLRNLTILTTSLPVANAIVANLSLENNVTLIIAGGIVRPGELSMVSYIPARTFEDLRVDKVFLGIGGLDLEAGLTEYNLDDALVKRAVLKSAAQKIVVVDGSKFGRVTFAHVAHLSQIDVIVTDSSAPPDDLEALNRMGIEVLVADSPSS